MSDKKSKIIEVTSVDHFTKLLGESSVPVLFDFYAPWCEPCQEAGPAVERVAVEYEGRLIVAKVDVEKVGDAAEMAGVEAIPSFVLGKAGEFLEGIEGWDGEEEDEVELREMVETLLIV